MTRAAVRQERRTDVEVATSAAGARVVAEIGADAVAPVRRRVGARARAVLAGLPAGTNDAAGPAIGRIRFGVDAGAVAAQPCATAAPAAALAGGRIAIRSVRTGIG